MRKLRHIPKSDKTAYILVKCSPDSQNDPQSWMARIATFLSSAAFCMPCTSYSESYIQPTVGPVCCILSHISSSWIPAYCRSNIQPSEGPVFCILYSVSNIQLTYCSPARGQPAWRPLSGHQHTFSSN